MREGFLFVVVEVKWGIRPEGEGLSAVEEEEVERERDRDETISISDSSESVDSSFFAWTTFFLTTGFRVGFFVVVAALASKTSQGFFLFPPPAVAV